MNMKNPSMRRTWIAVLIVTAAFSGCGGLQDTWEGPSAASFRPTSIAVLPPIIGALEGSRDLAHEVVTNALKKTKRYAVVIDPEIVNGILINSAETREVFAGYLSVLETSGISEAEAAKKLGQALKADALVIVRVNAWEYTRLEGDNLARVNMGIRLVDSRHGQIIWRGRHEKKESYIFFKPSLKDLGADLSEHMVKYIPK
jgi:ABC-type uncharacterized transport system auxiliary subunit